MAAERVYSEWNDPRNIGPTRVDPAKFRATWGKCFNCLKMVKLEDGRCPNCRSLLIRREA